MSLKALFTKHPADVGETYGQHFATAMSYSFPLFRAAFATAVHAILPFCFERTGSECIVRLHERLLATQRLESAKQKASAEPVEP